MRSIISFVLLLLVSFGGFIFADEGIRISEPLDGGTVNPGEEINIVVEPVDGLELREVLIVTPFAVETLISPPFSMRVMVPNDAAGILPISVTEQDSSGKFVGDEITLNIQQTAVLQSLEIDQDSILVYLDWDGNIDHGATGNIVTIYGIYSDGIKRDITHAGTSYVSSNPDVISIEDNGHYRVNEVGEASITVSNSGISQVIPVVFKEPEGIRPSETIRPTTQINIHPAPNALGWNNRDVTITLTASDNEGGSGVKQISYGLAGRGISSTPYTFVEGERLELVIREEGTARLSYAAWDNQLNRERNNFADIKLDKTPPQTTYSIDPAPDETGVVRSLPVRITFSATDNLSGVSHTMEGRIINEPGIHRIEYFSEDVAGNVEEHKTLTININSQDVVPPTIVLKLLPVKLNFLLGQKPAFFFGDSYKLVYSATDRESGIKNISAGLVMPDIANFRVEVNRPAFNNFIQAKQFDIKIDEKRKLVTINAPDSRIIMAQLREGLFSIQNNQALVLQLTAEKEWRIVKTDKCIVISAPTIVFKVKAADNARNTSTELLKYSK
ncbi:MAG: hypothetical protein AB1755_06580 [Candidatus Omnitrophota bacterium]